MAGYPMQDVRVIVYDGKTHPVDSKEIAFVMAGKKAFLDAVTKASAIVLEPIVNIELTIPESTIGDVSGDLASRRGQITGHAPSKAGYGRGVRSSPSGGIAGFPLTVESLTSGQGSYTLALSHHDTVPPNVQRQLIEAYKPSTEE
jgi:elongation factor G